VLSTVTHKPIANMPVAYYFGFIAPVLALLAGFGVEALPRTAPVLAGLIVVSMTAARPIVHPIFADYRGLLTAVRTSLRADDVIVVGAGFGRGVPGSVVYEAGGREILVLNRQSIDSIVDRAGKAGSVYFIPSLEAVTALVEREFIERLHLQPGAGYYESSMVPRTISLRGAPCRRGR
jgi:hypothetical protein